MPTDSTVTGNLDFLRTNIDHTIECDKLRLIKALVDKGKRLESVLAHIAALDQKIANHSIIFGTARILVSPRGLSSRR